MKRGAKVTIKKLATYILIIRVKKKFTERIGAQGLRLFDRGYYFYVGSGRRNLMQRIKRHLRIRKKKFWHIDYFLASPNTAIRDLYVTWFSEDEIVERFEMSRLVNPYDDYFGASDSASLSHLFFCRSYDDVMCVKKLMDSWS